MSSSLFENLGTFLFIWWITGLVMDTLIVVRGLAWRRGLMTATALYWGIAIGALLPFLMGAEAGGIILGILIGAVAFPILTYTVPGVNRFVLGFIVTLKLTGMIALNLMMYNGLPLANAIGYSMLASIISACVFMALVSMPASGYIVATAFLGAVGLSTKIQDIFSGLQYTFTGNMSLLFDPASLIFAVLGIDYADMQRIAIIVVCMGIGGYFQYRKLIDEGYTPGTPMIAYEKKK